MEDLKFEFQNLLTQDGDDKVSGPMSPMMAAQEMVKNGMFPKLDGLASVWFKGEQGEEVNNWFEGPGHRQGLTGCSTLLLVSYHANLAMYALVVDMGYALCPIGIWHNNDSPDDITITQVYQKKQWARALTVEEVQEIFQKADRSNLRPAGSPSLYEELKRAGIETSNHESDLYFPKNKKSTAIVNHFPHRKRSTFLNNLDGAEWYEVAFGYDPYWEEKRKSEELHES